jgi:CRISPR-associated protein (TIGR03985 family)
MNEVFNYPPTVEILKLLTPGSLKQNLPKAIRLWVILRSIYGDDSAEEPLRDEVKLGLGEEFTFLQWRDLFFIDASKHHLRDKAPSLHEQECNCAKTLTEWLFASNLSIDKNEWCQSFQKYYSIQSGELENLLLTGSANYSRKTSKQDKSSININNQKSHRFAKDLADGRLFAVTSRNLKDNDFQALVDIGWLKNKKVNNQDIYCKVDKFPNFPQAFLKDVENIQSQLFTNEDLSAFNDSLSQPINGIQRFFIHAEYIIHNQIIDRVELLQQQLKDIWIQDKIPFVQLTYRSAKLFQDTVDCIVYPVCIYYYQRAPYLFAYGQIPQSDGENRWNQVNWYDYRLDKILKLDELPKALENVDNHLNIPKHFVDKCWGKYPPNPDDIKSEMSDAWGFDIYKPKELLVLRFDRYFYDNYIMRTEREKMFKEIEHSQVKKLVKSYTPTASTEQKKLLSIVQSRSPDDIYRQVNYRVNDNNIVMRLRAWGPNVEVILPWNLRQRMKQEMESTYKLYI